MSDKLVKKINDLETSLGLLQHDFDSRNETVLWLTSRVQELEKITQRLAEQLRSLEPVDEPGDPLDEKPPHY